MVIARVLDVVLGVLRPAFFGAAVVATVLAALDWLVRTRRLSPFGPIARFTRSTIDPLFRPVERAVVRAGGNPASAPWWGVAFLVVSGLVVLSLLGFIRRELVFAQLAATQGAAGVATLILSWGFQLLRLALLVRVAASWFRLSEWSRWIRWAFVITDPIVVPLRRVIPPLGMVDITPIVAWLLIGLLETVVLSALR